MKTELDIANWNRKEIYNFFKDFDEPFYGITVNVDCTKAYELSKAKEYSFFLYYLHKSLVAVNTIEPFKYRIKSNSVYTYKVIHASITVLKPDNTFTFADIEFKTDYEAFELKAKNKMYNAVGDKQLNKSKYDDGVIHYSTLPWLHFTSVTHARKFSKEESCPKITFGKIIESNERKIMPVSIFAHHALIDGFSIGKYIELFRELLDRN